MRKVHDPEQSLDVLVSKRGDWTTRIKKLKKTKIGNSPSMTLVHGEELLKSFMKGRFPQTGQEGSGRGKERAKCFALRGQSDTSRGVLLGRNIGRRAGGLEQSWSVSFQEDFSVMMQRELEQERGH